mgnify:FL=1
MGEVSSARGDRERGESRGARRLLTVGAALVAAALLLVGLGNAVLGTEGTDQISLRERVVVTPQPVITEPTPAPPETTPAASPPPTPEPPPRPEPAPPEIVPPVPAPGYTGGDDSDDDDDDDADEDDGDDDD